MLGNIAELGKPFPDVFEINYILILSQNTLDVLFVHGPACHHLVNNNILTGCKLHGITIYHHLL